MTSKQNLLLQDRLNQLIINKKLTVLEAGCGSVSHISLGNVEKIVGIDISEKQLERNKQLDEKILGDIQTHDLGKQVFDIIISWDVLEHVEHPGKAIENFFQAIKPNGLIILAAPNFYSLKGFVTRLSPHLLHVWFYRYLIGDKRAGTEDFGPFKTYIKSSMWPRKINKKAVESGFSVEYFSEYEGPVVQSLRSRSKFIDFSFTLLGYISKFLTFGKLDMNNSDYMLVLRKI